MLLPTPGAAVGMSTSVALVYAQWGVSRGAKRGEMVDWKQPSSGSSLQGGLGYQHGEKLSLSSMVRGSQLERQMVSRVC